MYKSSLDTIVASVHKATNFYLNYNTSFPDSGILDITSCWFNVEDIHDIARVFGKTGWKRVQSYDGENWHWKREIDGIDVMIRNAEKNDFVNSPVPEKSWPVLLEETTASSGNDYSAFEQYDTSAT